MVVQRFTTPILRGFAFARRSISDPPKDGDLCFADDGGPDGWRRRPVPARFKDGIWSTHTGRPLPFLPTYWSIIERQPNEV